MDRLVYVWAVLSFFCNFYNGIAYKDLSGIINLIFSHIDIKLALKVYVQIK